MKKNEAGMKDILKRCGIVLLSMALVVTGTFAMSGALSDNDDAYAVEETAKDTEEAVEGTFPNIGASSTSDTLIKDETVYVIKDADGNKEETVVSEWIKNPEGLETIDDKSTLTDITNTSGDETFTQNGNKITWDAQGKDIKYTGKTNDELPVSCDVTYYLDGEEVSADEIAGQSGEIEIHFDYFVNVHDRVKVNGKGYDVEHPYIMASGVMLDNEHFDKIEISNGRCINQGESTVCVGIALPGIRESIGITGNTLDIPEEIVIKAETDNFGIDGTYTAALTGFMKDVDISSGEIKDDIDKLESALDQLSDASSELVKATDKLADGTDTLAEGASSLADGTSQLTKGTSSLKSGASKLASGTSQLNSKSKTLADGVDTLYNGSKTLTQGTSQIKDGTSQAEQGAKDLSDGLSAISENSGALNDATKTIENTMFESATAQLQAAIAQAILPQVMDQIKAQIKQQLIAGGMSEEEAEAKAAEQAAERAPAAAAEQAQQYTLTPSTYKTRY